MADFAALIEKEIEALDKKRAAVFDKQEAWKAQGKELDKELAEINKLLNNQRIMLKATKGEIDLESYTGKKQQASRSTGPRTPRDPNAPVRVRGSGKPAPLEEELIEQFRELGGVTTKAKLMELRGVASDDKQGYARLSNLLNALSKKEPLPFITKTGERGGYRLQEEAIKEASAS